ncbi:MAG: DUF2550 domain-containing protein [Actinomycetota bacterium]|nr:DUF2550 domain-containing protein [Actinomycetota bacterium]
MPTALISFEIVVGALVAVIVGFLAATYARRRAISRGRLLTLSGWRRRPGDSWRLGHLRLGSSQLEWFSLFGVSARPQHCWERAVLGLEPPQDIHPSDVIDLMPDASPVRCTYGTRTFELALTPHAYTALRSWAEASPPGSTANVA